MFQIFNKFIFLSKLKFLNRNLVEDKNLVIKYIKGSGKGGSKRNTTQNNVQIIDKDSGIIVKVILI